VPQFRHHSSDEQRMGNTYPTQHNHENLRKVVGAEYTIFMSLEKQGTSTY